MSTVDSLLPQLDSLIFQPVDMAETTTSMQKSEREFAKFELTLLPKYIHKCRLPKLTLMVLNRGHLLMQWSSIQI